MPRSLQWPGHSLAFTHSAPGGARRRDFLAGSLSTPSLLWRVLYHVTLAPGKGTCESCFSMGTSLYSKQLHRGLYMWYLLSSALHWRAHSQFFTPSIPQYIVAFGASETRQAARDSSLQEGPVRPTGQLHHPSGSMHVPWSLQPAGHADLKTFSPSASHGLISRREAAMAVMRSMARAGAALHRWRWEAVRHTTPRPPGACWRGLLWGSKGRQGEVPWLQHPPPRSPWLITTIPNVLVSLRRLSPSCDSFPVTAFVPCTGHLGGCASQVWLGQLYQAYQGSGRWQMTGQQALGWKSWRSQCRGEI
mmetsp:Transcript_66356/g.209780  ORF Transcript_66356/g.209780 Transcript_66356/m.209780 type:complete len:305 (+) Transcript_66356:1969-2883(+)